MRPIRARCNRASYLDPMLIRLSVLLASAVGSSPARAQQPPGPPVVIYLHGRIVEDQGPNAVSPDYGEYRYQAIIDSLKSGGARVLGAIRRPNTNPDDYAKVVAAEVDSLLAAGIAPARITVVGFSKGGGIAIRASARLGRTDIGFVFMGACQPGPVALNVAGRILSLYEESDSLGRSCQSLFANALPGTEHAEQVLHTGLRHGTFYRPIPAWLVAVGAWRDGHTGRPDPMVLGRFDDDYDNHYTIGPAAWLQEPRARYHIAAWHPDQQYLIARNDGENPGEPGLWTRIDWVALDGMAPYRWGFCYTTYAAPSLAAAETIAPATRATPRSGCGGHPFSRMKSRS